MLSLKIANRFLFSKKREKFISINSFLAVGSVALSVLVLIVVTSVMSGFDLTLREKIMTMTPHLTLNAEGPINQYDEMIGLLKKDPEVTSASPFVMGSAMMEAGGKVFTIQMMGLEDPDGYKMLSLDKYMKEGPCTLARSEVLIGSELAKMISGRIGGVLKIQSPALGYDDEIPSELIFTIKGIYESGLYDYDSRQVFIRLEDAKVLYGFTTQAHGIGISVKNPEGAGNVKNRFFKIIPDGWTLRTWIENNRTFFSALRTEKNVMFILLAFAILIASINIISTLVMMVMEKFKDIGIMKAIGFTKRKILSIFLIEGFMIGFIGTGIGTLCGVVFVKYINVIQDFVSRYTGYEVFPADVYYFDSIPARLTPEDLTLIILLGLGTSILASLYPAYKAATMEAIEALHHE